MRSEEERAKIRAARLKAMEDEDFFAGNAEMVKFPYCEGCMFANKSVKRGWRKCTCKIYDGKTRIANEGFHQYNDKPDELFDGGICPYKVNEK